MRGYRESGRMEDNEMEAWVGHLRGVKVEEMGDEGNGG